MRRVVVSSDFDCWVNRHDTCSVKWELYGQDVLPMWVADMDFRSPPPVIAALQERVLHGVYGYTLEPADLRDIIVAWLEESYGWTVVPEALVFVPGVVVGFNLACHVAGKPGDSVLLHTPIYYPMLDAPANAGRRLQEMQLIEGDDGRYLVDYDRMQDSIDSKTGLFMLCNPHNPVGRVFQRDELERMAEICAAQDVLICSDEIHCDLTYTGHSHIPIASLSPEIGQRTITLMAPTKTFNLAGLHFSVAIIENETLRNRFQRAGAGLVPSVGAMGYAAGRAAYRDGRPWLEALIPYLQANRDYVREYLNSNLPGIRLTPTEGTYLAWLDCRERELLPDAHTFFLEQAKVALNPGERFGPGGEGHVRLNFGCCRKMLEMALDRMARALTQESL